MSAPTSIEFDLATLPSGLRYDGIMPGAGTDWMQFTELDEASPSFGASFYIDTRAAALMSAVADRREHKRKQFAGEAPLDP